MRELLSLFELRDIEIEIFEKLFFEGEMSASVLAKKVGISRTSVYDLLEKLIEKGLIFESPKGGIKKYAVHSPAKLKLLLEEREKDFKKARKSLEYLEQVYFKKDSSKSPTLQMYRGKTALQQMMKDMLLYRDMTVLAYWPILRMIEILGSTFLHKFHQERIQRNISLKTIWPARQIPSIKKFPYLKISEDYKREVRIAPPNVSFSLGYVVYRNTVRFLSSSKENYGFLIESQELAEMMKSQFQIIWQNSKPYKNSRR